MGLCHFIRSIVTLSLIVTLTACGITSNRVDNNVSAPPKTGDYVIGAGDQLDIRVRDNPDLSLQLPVRPDGKISLPLVDEVEAAGSTPAELSKDLEKRFETYIRDPDVTVIVKDFVGAYADRIRIIGEAVQPQALAYRDGMTVLDAIIQVGGLTEFAAGNRTKLVRRIDGEVMRYEIHLGDLLNEGAIGENRSLRPGDVLIIPQAYF